MTYLYSNNAATTLAVEIDDTVTQFTVLDASLFPSSATVDDPFKVTVQDVDTGELEICDCTNVSGNVLTVVRGRENTASIAFPIGTIVHHRITAENLNNFVQDLENVGVGEGQVAQGRVGPEARFKTIRAGSNASVQNDPNEVLINAINTANANNVGLGEGQVYKDNADGYTLNLRTIKQGQNVTVTMPGDDTITVSSSDTASGANLGVTPGRQGIYVDSTGTQLNLKSLVPGTDIGFSADGEEITINYTGSGGGGDARGNIPTGLYTGGEVTASATPGSVDVAAGTGIIVDAMTDPANPTYTEVSWGAQTVDIATPPDNEVTVVIDSAGLVQLDFGGLQHDEPLFSPQARDTIMLAVATCVAGVVTSIVPYNYAVNLGHHTFYDYYSASGGAFLPDPHKDQFLSPENNRVVKFYGEDAGINRFFSLNAGGRGDNFFDIVGHPLSGELTYWQMFDRGGTFYGAPGPQIDVAQYSPSGTRIPIPAPDTAASIIMLYHAPGVGMYAEYAYDFYDTLDEACLDLAKYTRSYQSGRYRPVDNWLLVGALIARKDANDLSDTSQARLYPFERNNFRSPFFIKSTILSDEAAPSLSGNLETNGYDIILQDGSSNERGRIISVGTSNSVVFGFVSDPTGGIDPTTDGAIFAKAGELTITGTITEVTSLAGDGVVQVYASDDGVLYGVEPPIPGWEQVDTDTADYTFPTLATWVQITGLFITVPQDVDIGDRIDAAINLYFQNSNPTQGGTLDIGIGIDGADPTTAANSVVMPGGFNGVVATSITTTNHGGLTSGQNIGVFVRRAAEDDPTFGPNLLGSVDPSELIVSVPSGSIGGPGGDPTNLGNVPGPTSVTITSSTGTNTVIAGANTGPNGAGVMTEAQVVSLNSKIDATGVTYANLNANGDVGTGVTQVAQGDHLHPGVYDPAGSAAAVQTNLDTHVADAIKHLTPDQNDAVDGANLPSASNVFITANDLGGFVVTGGTVGQYYRKQSATDYDALFEDLKIQDDTVPILGGDLQTSGNDIIIQDDLTNEKGRLAYVSTEDAVALGRIADPTQGFDPTSDGAIFLKPGQVDITGAVTEILNLSGQGTQQVYVSDGGALYGVDPPAAGWEESATSTFDHDFTNGNTTGAWVEVTGLTINPTADVDVGDRVDVYTSLYVENIEDKPGTLEVAVGINGADPVSVGASKNIAPESISFIPVSWTTTNHGGLVTTDTFTVYARRGTSTDDAHLYLQGSTREHEYIVSVPGGGSGGGGDPTDLGNIPAPTSVTITSSTGSNTVLAAAGTGNNAGVMTNQQVLDLAAKVDTGSSLGTGEGTVFSAKVGTDLQFKSLRQGSNVTITETGTEITINSADPGGGISEPTDDLFGYLREGAASEQWVRGARVFEQATPPSTPSVGDVWIDTT